MRKSWLMTAALLGLSSQAHAINWIQMQGKEMPNGPDHKQFGFVWVDYQRTQDSRLPAGTPFAGQRAAFNQIGPKLKDSSDLTLRRARVVARGWLSRENNINYFVSALGGDNGVTRLNQGNRVRITDASLSWHPESFSSIRVGMFKYPGSEEALQPIPPRNYINFSNVGGQLVQERFFETDGTNTTQSNQLERPVAAFRDVGVQLFDTIDYQGWQITYAGMLGNGRGIRVDESSSRPETYLYLSAENVFGGHHMKQQGLKLFGWHQDGERDIKVGAAQQERTFDRTRYGAGFTYYGKPWRFTGEWIKAKGMIFNSADGGAVPGSLSNNGLVTASFNVLPDDEADGFYLDAAYTFLPGWTAAVRYDRLNRGTETSAAEREFETTTIGLSWKALKQLRLMLNYEIRDIEAPNLPGGAAPNRILNETDNRVALQALYYF